MTSEQWVEMFIDVTNPANPRATFTVGNLYRPPHTAIAEQLSLTAFINYFSEKLALLNTRGNKFVCDDYNINLLYKRKDICMR